MILDVPTYGDAPGRLAGAGRLDVDRPPFVGRDHDTVAVVAQRRGQRAQHAERQVGAADGGQQTLAVGASVGQGRRLEGDDRACDGRVRLAGVQSRGGEDLAAALRGPDFDADPLRQRRRLAGQPPALGQLAGRHLAAFDLVGLVEAARTGAYQGILPQVPRPAQSTGTSTAPLVTTASNVSPSGISTVTPMGSTNTLVTWASFR